MTLRLAALASALALAGPLAAQTTDAPQQRGTFLVYAEDSGAAFVSREQSLVEAGVWPLEFHYFEDGETIGTARMTGSADCDLGVVRGRLTDVNGEPLPDAESLAVPQFTFDRAAAEGGDPAIVNFICGSGPVAASAEVPITRSVAETLDLYRRLTGLGLAADIASRLAVRDAEAGAALARTLVPAEQQAAAIELLGSE